MLELKKKYKSYEFQNIKYENEKEEEENLAR